MGFRLQHLRRKTRLKCDLWLRFKIITGSLVILENLFPENYRYRYRLEIRMNYHYRYRLGPRSRPFISIDSQLPSRKSFELIFSKLPLPLPSFRACVRILCVQHCSDLHCRAHLE